MDVYSKFRLLQSILWQKNWWADNFAKIVWVAIRIACQAHFYKEYVSSSCKYWLALSHILDDYNAI